MNHQQNSKDSFYYTFGLYSTVGVQLVISVLIGFYVGNWVDEKWGTEPWLMVLGLVLGAVAGFYNLFRIVSKKGQS